jgi:hypothetical protein
VATTELIVTRPTLHAAQAQVVAEAQRFNVLQCGRRFGKTTLGVDLLLDPALDGFPVAWFAPTYKLLDEVWRELTRATVEIQQHVDKQQRRLELITGGVIDCWTLDGDDPARGRRYKRVVIDEAGIVRDLQDKWTAAIRPTLADFQGDAWLLGTPKGRGYFHTLYLRGQQGDPGWASWRFATVDNPHIAAEEVESARRDIPEAAFKQEFLGEPADDAGNPFGLDAIRACVGPLSSAAPAVWGVDLAKSLDWTWAIALDGAGRVCRSERWQAPWSATIERLAAMLGKSGAPALVDSTGVGDPIVEQLQSRCGTLVEGYKFTSQSKQQLMEGLAAAIQQGRVTIPDGPLVAELEAYEYTFTPSGVRYSAPEGLHDDGVCALALAVQAKSQPRTAFYVV